MPRTSGGTGGGGGGAGGLIVRKFAFAHNDAGLDTGEALYTPTVGDILYNAWLSITTAWNGTTPKGDVGLFTAGFTGLFTSAAGLVYDMTNVDNLTLTGIPFSLSAANVTLIAAGAPPSGDRASGAFLTTDPVCVVVSQDGTPTVQATVNADEAPPTIPLTIVTSVNDTFIFTGASGGGSPETFTMAPGVYATLNAILVAMAAATGSVSGEHFSTLCSIDDSPNYLQLTVEVDTGIVGNGDTITEGNGGAAALGFTGNPDTFAGGTGGNPGSTLGAGILYLVTATPTT